MPDKPPTCTPPCRAMAVSLLLLASLLALGGCATRQEVMLAKTNPTSAVRSVATVPDAGNSAAMDAHLASALQKAGLNLRPALPAGTRTTGDVDAIVSYVDVWRWDLVMYLAAISVRLHDARNGDLLVWGQWRDSALHGFRDPAPVVEGLVAEMVERLRVATKGLETLPVAASPVAAPPVATAPASATPVGAGTLPDKPSGAPAAGALNDAATGGGDGKGAATAGADVRREDRAGSGAPATAGVTGGSAPVSVPLAPVATMAPPVPAAAASAAAADVPREPWRTVMAEPEYEGWLKGQTAELQGLCRASVLPRQLMGCANLYLRTQGREALAP